MRVALLNTMSPYVRGGAEISVDDTENKMKEYGHDVSVFRLSLSDDYGAKMIASAVAARALRFDSYDRVICFKYPTFCISHPRKVIWACHQLRQVYDLWGIPPYGLMPDPGTNAIKAITTFIDNKCISEARHIYTNGMQTAKRLKRFNGISAVPLNPPLKDTSAYYFEKTGDYLFYPSRITELKRQFLAVEAMRYVKSGVKLVIAGSSESGEYSDSIAAFIRQRGLEKKVTFINKWIPEEEKLRLMAESLGCLFIPLDEDFGFITMEAFYSRKPVITCTDSGGPCDFVEDGISGYICEPSAKALAKSMDILFEDRALAENMGENAYLEIISRKITWEETIKRLLI